MRKNILLVCCLAIATALSVRAETIVALTSANRLLSFDSATPGPTEIIVDIAAAVQTQLVNISTRGRVGQGEDVLIGGFITRGAAKATVVVRAIGPSLYWSGNFFSAPRSNPDAL
jgi:hypothetical protein